MVVAGVVFLLGASLAAQQPAQPPTFKSNTQIVEVDVRVFDKSGHFLTTLKPEDFQLLEDGTPQKIQSLVLIDRSLPAQAPLEPRSGETSPKPPAASATAEAGPQVWLFVFDTAHLSPAGLQRTREAVSKFIADRFRQGDIGGVVVDGKMANNRLTSDRDELKNAIQAMKMPGDQRAMRMELTRDWPRFQDEYEASRIANDNDQETLKNVITRACSEEPDQCNRVPPDAAVMEKARRLITDVRRSTLATLSVAETLSNGLARIAGSKTIVFLSEGFMTEHLESELRQVEGLANRAGAHFYALDARGLNKGANAEIIDRPLAQSSIGPTAHFDALDDGPNSLAVDTGGFFIRNENNFGRALDLIQQDAGTYYVLAYSPTNEKFDGKYRTIAVKVAQPDVKVRARRGYVALPPARLLNAANNVGATGARGADAGHAEGPGAPVPSTRPAPLATPAIPGASGAPDSGAPVAPPPSTPVTPLAPRPAAPSPSAAPSASAARLTPTEVVAALGHTGGGADDAAARGWAAYQRGDVETAATELKSALTEPAARPWAAYVLGLSEFALRHYREAVDAWENVRTRVPEFEPIYFSLADAYSLEHEEGDAIKTLRAAQQRWPQDPELANAVGVIQVRRGALDAAIESFDHAVALAPADSIGYFNLGRAHQMRMVKAQRYVPEVKKWVGGDADRKKAADNYQKHIDLGGPYAQQAREALAQLGWS